MTRKEAAVIALLGWSISTIILFFVAPRAEFFRGVLPGLIVGGVISFVAVAHHRRSS